MASVCTTSGASRINFSASNCTGQSNWIFANSLESKPSSLLASIFSFIFPFSLSVFANRFSIEPNSAKNFLAVFSPTPGKPGILSTASPIIPRKSITCSGYSTPNFSCTSGIPHISGPLPFLAGRYIKIFSDTNWAKSLSEVTINTLKSSFSACFANVPIKSSASIPATSIIGMCIALSKA